MIGRVSDHAQTLFAVKYILTSLTRQKLQLDCSNISSSVYSGEETNRIAIQCL